MSRDGSPLKNRPLEGSEPQDVSTQKYENLLADNKRLNQELMNMIRAERKFFEFQEKLNGQLEMYSKIADAGRRFNTTMNLEEVLESTANLCLYHLNYERAIVYLWNDRKKVIAAAKVDGYYDEELASRVQKFQFHLSDKAMRVLDDVGFLVSEGDNDFKITHLALDLTEIGIYSLGYSHNQILGFIVVGNSESKMHLHARVKDPNLNIVLRNLTNQISAAIRTIENIQTIELESARVDEQAKKISNLLNNMNQAVFSVDGDGTVGEPVSAHSTKVFGKSIVGDNVFHFLYCHLNEEELAISQIRNAMGIVFGENRIQWRLQSHTFPKFIRWNRPDGNSCALRISHSPIWLNGVLDKIMYVVEDVTQLEVLERQFADEKKSFAQNFQIVREISLNSTSDLNRFFFNLNGNLLLALEEKDPIGSTLRALHRLKGEARMMQFQYLARTVHESESVLTQLRSLELAEKDVVDKIRTVIEGVNAVADEYRRLVLETSPVHSRKEGPLDQVVEVPAMNFARLVQMANAPTQPKKCDLQLRSCVRDLLNPPLESIFLKFEPMVKEISTRLNKQVQLVYSGSHYCVDSDQLNEFKEILTHLIRNSLDHGIENTEARKDLGKSPIATISLHVEKTTSRFTMIYKDDGAGLDVAKLKAKAEQMSRGSAGSILESHGNPADLIFIPSLSTKDRADDLSGRGIGMDIVKQAVDSIHAQITIDSRAGRGVEFRIVKTEKIHSLEEDAI